MKKKALFPVFVAFILIAQACNMPGSEQPTETNPPPVTEPPTSESSPAATAVQHQVIPVSAPDSKPYPDVTSQDTAPEKRAPYGDNYDLNRLERPFTQDMTYIPDMDIASFSISEDADWFYVSIGMVGKNPNNSPGINIAVELDTNRDGFGDFLILAKPPYSEEWTAENVKIYSDTNRDTAGNSATKSDAPFSGNGYDQLIHDLEQGVGNDPDLVWVRTNTTQNATVQIAFKKSFAGSSFLYGALADSGLKDVTRLDYVDYFMEQEAGSPIRSSTYYPLKALYAVDNTCYQAYGFKPSGYEPKICPEIVQPQEIIREPGDPISTPEPGCQDPGNCPYGWAGEPYCFCMPG
ncbi:MAG: hypothetical protein C4557_02835 [Anaerolineaceae bacterium]|nr:MAG: hypothetical protein C4557_02835 [Anaerolineaceae bacterium]